MSRLHVVACASFLVVAGSASAPAQIPTTFSNLRVLPRDIPRADLVSTMRGMAGALGVRCAHCHVGPDNLEGMDFATDQKQSKQIARTMLRMVRSINVDFVSAMPAGDSPRQPVTCLTCHRRSTRPPRPLPDLLLGTIDASGVRAAIQQYRQLRAEALDAGLYDFREHTLNIVATTLREQKRLAEALDMLRLNAEIHPNSAAVQVNLGDTAAQNGNPELAGKAYRRALELDPGNPRAVQGLERLKGK
jgi:hypothetical protein